MLASLLQSHRAARVAGIEIRVTYMLYLFIGAIPVAQALQGGSTRYLAVLTAALIFYPFFNLAHELAHSLFAMRCGIRVRRIILHPIGGVAELEGLIPHPAAEMKIALAGPLASLAIAGVLYPGLLLAGYANPMAAVYGSQQMHVAILAVTILINLAMGIFNLLPIFPMDGGRIATALAVLCLGAERGIQIMRPVALVSALLLAAVGAGVMSEWSVRAGAGLILISSFLYTTGHQEMQARAFASRYAAANPGAAEDRSTAAPE